MKKIISALSFVSFFLLVVAMTVLAMFAGGSVANYLVVLLGIEGWQCALMFPIVFAVAFAVMWFFLLGIQLVVKWNAYRFN